MAEQKNHNLNNQLFGSKHFTNEEELIDQINLDLLSLKSSFASGKSYMEVSELKNARKSVLALVGTEIAKNSILVIVVLIVSDI